MRNLCLLLGALCCQHTSSFFHVPGSWRAARAEIVICSDRPFKVGTHTYAAWDNQASKGRQDDEDEEEFFGEDEYEDEDDEDDDEEAVSDGTRYDASATDMNPLKEWARKIYDAVFFYGLDAQIPGKSRAVKSRPTRPRRPDIVKSKKSLFFTATEQLGQDFINSKETDTTASAPPTKKVKSSQPTRSESQAAKLERRIQVLDDCIQNMTRDLSHIDATLQNANSEEGKRELLEKRKNIAEAVEALQVQLVALSIELEG